MTKLTIAVDVDLTIVDTLGPWLQHFESVTGVKYPTHKGREKYHLGPIMQALAMDAGVLPWGTELLSLETKSPSLTT